MWNARHARLPPARLLMPEKYEKIKPVLQARAIFASENKQYRLLFCPCLESKNEVLNLKNPSYPANKILRNLRKKRSVRIITDSQSVITANCFITQYCLYSEFGPP